MSSSARAQRAAAAQEAARAQFSAQMAVMKRLSAQQQQRNGKPQLLLPGMERFRHNRELPLSLLLIITKWLDDVADISRVTRTSKLLYYMTLPRLWEHVTLRSYSEIRYKDGLPAGFGNGSPFAKGLEALVSGNVAVYVKTLRLVGEWREVDVEEFSKGRVPDNTMLLNVAIRAALDKCEKLESFRWELSVKPLRTIYQGLAARPTLQSLTLKFPSRRIPGPTTTIPPMPNLKYLHIYDIDPLCYPDDISLLLMSSTKLEDLKLEWNPRIRREKEPSVSFDSYFGRAKAAGVKLPLKRLAIKNLYARSNADDAAIFAFDVIESMTTLNCMNPEDLTSIFFDNTWQMHPPDFTKMKSLKKIRTDIIDRRSHEIIVQMAGGLEEAYIVNRNSYLSQSSSPTSANQNTTPGSQNGNADGVLDTPGRETPFAPPTASYAASPSVACDFIAALTSHHGSTLRILLLSDQWSLNDEVIKLIVRSCPNLEQLGVALEGQHFSICRQIFSQLPKLRAFRILHPGGVEDRIIESMMTRDGWADMAKRGRDLIAKEVWRNEYKNIKYFALGSQAFEFGKVVRLGDEGDDGEREMRRVVKPLKWEEVKDKCEIFRMDSLDI